MDQGDAASEYLKRVFGGTGEGLALQVLTGTQAMAEISLLRHLVARGLNGRKPNTSPDDELAANKVFASLVADVHSDWNHMADSTRRVLATRLMLAMSTAEAAGDTPFISIPPGLARELIAVAAVLRTSTRPVYPPHPHTGSESLWP